MGSLLCPDFVFLVVFLVDECNGHVLGGGQGGRVSVGDEGVIGGIKVDVVDGEEAGSASDRNFGVFAAAAREKEYCDQQVSVCEEELVTHRYGVVKDETEVFGSDG